MTGYRSCSDAPFRDLCRTQATPEASQSEVFSHGMQKAFLFRQKCRSFPSHK